MVVVAASSVTSPLGLSIMKLIEVVEEENAALRQQKIISHASYTDRKNHALRELLAAQKQQMTSVTHGPLDPSLRRLSQALQVNARLLKQHIAAVGEVSDIIVSSLREADSDGTYRREPRMQLGR